MINAKMNMQSYKKITSNKKNYISKFSAVFQTVLKIRKKI